MADLDLDLLEVLLGGGGYCVFSRDLVRIPEPLLGEGELGALLFLEIDVENCFFQAGSQIVAGSRFRLVVSALS